MENGGGENNLTQMTMDTKHLMQGNCDCNLLEIKASWELSVRIPQCDLADAMLE